MSRKYRRKEETMRNLEEQTKQILKENHLYANKKLGQNFLINEEIVEEIVKGAEVNEKDLVIEIGPGLGTLTEVLLQKAGRVVCIELDTNMISVLEKRFTQKTNFELIHQDVLKVDLKTLIAQEKQDYCLTNVKVVANLPYYITTPILMKLLEEKLEIQSITVMVQKEVAQRLTAKPGEEYTGAITYTIHYYTKPSILIDVPRENFMPAPEVDSAVMHMEVLKKPNVKIEDEKLFFQIIKLAFGQKRKTLVNALTNSGFLEKQQVQEMLQQMGLDEKIRGEKITMEQFAMLTHLVKEKNI